MNINRKWIYIFASGSLILLIVFIIIVLFTSNKETAPQSNEHEEYDECERIILSKTIGNENCIEQHIDDDEIEKNVESATKYRWPNNIIVYKIADNNYNDKDINLIKNAMHEIESKICVKFTEVNDKEYHVLISNKKGNSCSSDVGYLGWMHNKLEQNINLGKGCMHHGIIIHELSHTLGMDHMQNDKCRDKYIKICWDNIKKGHTINFNIRKSCVTYGLPYDYDSIMHYGDKNFAINRDKRTLVPIVNKSAIVGQRKGYSQIDIKKLRYRYLCDSDKVPNEKPC